MFWFGCLHSTPPFACLFSRPVNAKHATVVVFNTCTTDGVPRRAFFLCVFSVDCSNKILE